MGRAKIYSDQAKSITIRLEPIEFKQLRKMRKVTGKSYNSIMREALKLYVACIEHRLHGGNILFARIGDKKMLELKALCKN